jgi:hypothetical protein
VRQGDHLTLLETDLSLLSVPEPFNLRFYDAEILLYPRLDAGTWTLVLTGLDEQPRSVLFLTVSIWFQAL